MAEFRRVFSVQGMDSDATPKFQMVPSSGKRYVALHDGKGMAVASGNTAVCTVTEIPESSLPAGERASGINAAVTGDRFFRLDGVTKGVTLIAAVSLTSLPTFLEVGVKDKILQRIQFYSVKDNAGHFSRRPLAISGEWIPGLNYIFKRQANIEIVRHGAPKTVKVNQNLGDPVVVSDDVPGATELAIAATGNQTADLNVFFLWEVQTPSGGDTDAIVGVIGSAHLGAGPGFVLFEDNAGSGAMLSMAHEFGHHMGLTHREVNKKDLMWPFTGQRGLNLTKEDVNIANP
jgi:hypothetical protein